ncbi:hypothetical protein VOLCADRAFT_97344 [Volvox carteri f. nagariensis]|uniref:Wax synthase domain-containing protein n=1 Tax=Volvox carteri f. nagariensis TaxID=3068 RepID=D8UCI2_VOLCA|nr:uncharacterized protein VOLCADRAFT_97344 [Volvox carteri f. nagariensis]EFJ42497.1 hypothetical protein VOLCADRAFT_97344 [Volvox carteri f. nagariensis]|eukprot:XP_002956353.1 hypothetical protein VOLCADRAFT_97344 [Volvox carteri f. nagariensis]
MAVATPAVAALIASPFLFHPINEPILSMMVTFMSVRMPLTKLLAACYARGPLVALPPPRNKPVTAKVAKWLRQSQLLRRWWPKTPMRSSRAAATSAEAAATAGCGINGHSDDDKANKTVPMAAEVPDLALVTFFMLSPVVPRPCRTDARYGGGGDNTCPLRREHSSTYSARGDCRRLLRELAGKWLAFASACALAVMYGRTAPLALHAALAYGMLAIMGGMMDLTALYCTTIWGVDLVPPFHNPFQATSLSDFWARRWNVTQSRVLKGLLYDPIVEGRLVPSGNAAVIGNARCGGGGGGGCGGAVGNVVVVDSCSGGDAALPAAAPPARSVNPADGASTASRVTDNGNINGDDPDATFSGSFAAGADNDSDGDRALASCRGATASTDGGAAAGDWAPGRDVEGSDPDGQRAPAPRVMAALASVDAGKRWTRRGAATAAAVVRGHGKGSEGDGGESAASCSFFGGAADMAAMSATVAAAAGAARAVLSNTRTRRAVALLAVFIFSGIEHEIFHWYVQRFFSGQWLTFFAVHGVLLVAEEALRQAAARGGTAAARAPRPAPDKAAEGIVTAVGTGMWRTAASLAAAAARLPPWVSRLLTLAVLELTATWWFFDVLLEPGIVARTVGSLKGMMLLIIPAAER